MVFSSIEEISRPAVREYGLHTTTLGTIQNGYSAAQAFKNRSGNRQPYTQAIMIPGVTIADLVISLECFFLQLDRNARPVILHCNGCSTVRARLQHKFYFPILRAEFEGIIYKMHQRTGKFEAWSGNRILYRNILNKFQVLRAVSFHSLEDGPEDMIFHINRLADGVEATLINTGQQDEIIHQRLQPVQAG